MSSFTDVFSRKEMKYRIDKGLHDVLLAKLSDRLSPGEYASSTVRSLYFDTQHFQLIERSLDKPLYKEKLRMRIYGDELSGKTPTFLEIKKKYKGIVYKRRVALSFDAACAYMEGQDYESACRQFPLDDSSAAAQSLSIQSTQISREIDFFRERYAPLFPAMVIACDRQAYVDPESDLRVTLDSNLRANDRPCCIESLTDDASMRPILDVDEIIMEVKSAGSLPLWLVQALSESRAYKQSFSKYGMAYTQMRKGA